AVGFSVQHQHHVVPKPATTQSAASADMGADVPAYRALPTVPARASPMARPAVSRHPLKVRAVCLSRACTDPCGGRGVIPVPTAIKVGASAFERCMREVVTPSDVFAAKDREDPMTARGAIYPDLEGKSVIVTGGAQGIGASIVRAFARQKSKVGFIDIAEGPTEELARELGGDSNFVDYAIADIRDIPALKAAIELLTERHGQADVLVNN